MIKCYYVMFIAFSKYCEYWCNVECTLSMSKLKSRSIKHILFIIIDLTEDAVPDPGAVSGSRLPRPRPRPRPLRLDGGARLGRQLRQRRLQLSHAAPRRPGIVFLLQCFNTRGKVINLQMVLTNYAISRRWFAAKWPPHFSLELQTKVHEDFTIMEKVSTLLRHYSLC